MDTSVYVILCCLVLGVDVSCSCGALTIIKPTFVNRNVTLKFIPHNQWITNIAWKYTPVWDETNEHTVEGLKGRFTQTVQDASNYHTFLFYANIFYNNSKFHVQCSNLKDVTRSNTVKIHLHEIKTKCGNLVLLSPEIKYGKNVQLAFYPSDATLANEKNLYNERTMLKWVGQPLHLREVIFEKRKMSAYLYTIYNFTENKAGHYTLKCNRPETFYTNWVNIQITEKGSDPFSTMPEYIHNENTTVSCEVSNARPPAMIELLVDNLAIIDVIQVDSINKTSKTYSSKALISKIDKKWNGKEICCRRKFTIYGNIGASCKTLKIKCGLENDTQANGLCNETKWTSNLTETKENRKIEQKPTNPTKNGTKFCQEPTIVAGTNFFLI
ncbi:uncharacterized protein LOC128234130 isoform X2 [Mya arenaria]|uniref:uncharacterized protein LOC128234130 isoform X2 n=1 Tax=Mya arenaria TaxID=6604 RepID=UPI0022E211BB|nr:uncharacterized protein LOC128234130 isoform X2 [Mya arenaria]